MGETVGEEEGENHEACKRWMCSLITGMTMVAFHLLSLKHLVTPFSWWCKYLLRLITHMTSRHMSILQSFVTHVHTYACIYAHTWTYDMHHCTLACTTTCTGPWQIATTKHPAVMTGSGGSGQCCALRREELSSASSCPTGLLPGWSGLGSHAAKIHSLRISLVVLVVHVCELTTD